MIDPDLASYATVRQLEYLEAVEAHGTHRKAAKALGVDQSAVSRSILAVQKKAAAQGYSPAHGMTKTVPEGFKVKGVSTLYNGKGEVASQWVKSSADEAARAEAMREAFAAMSEELPRLSPVGPHIGMTESKLLTLYTLTDSHVGAACEAALGGGDWNQAEAERVLVGCFAQMVNASPPAEVGFVNQLGDFLHSDGVALEAVTPQHRHILDQDGRFPSLAATAVRILRQVITLALAKHERVVVLLAEGNHDMASSVWLRLMFRVLYENEPRVTVIDSELPYYIWSHGKVMLAFHHGHMKKMEGLPLLFASQFPKVWGDASVRIAHTGHRHHGQEQSKEYSGMTVIQHPTLAARDAYAARGGWMSERSVTAITYHSAFGQVARTTVTPEMLLAA
jgi:hypothetical protein